MSQGRNNQLKFLTLTQRNMGLLACFFVVAVAVGLALSLPYFYETQSLWYKFGAEKTVLRAGKMVGLVCLVLLCCQLILSCRLRFLERLVGLDKLLLFHRVNGCVIFCLVIMHGVLILLPEGLANIPIGKKYWPEMVGMAGFCCIVVFIPVSVFRKSLHLPYQYWRPVHRGMGYLIVMLVLVHLFTVSETFEQLLPRVYLTILIVTVFGAVALAWLGRHRNALVKGELVGMKQRNESITEVTVSLAEHYSFSLLPGQFVFMRFDSGPLTESHPFTPVSPPAHKNSMRFMIKNCGDWTSKLHTISAGAPVVIEGPYGLFSHLAHKRFSELLFIAGGIGITPLLAMLDYMAENNDLQPVTLIWSNSHVSDQFLRVELEELQQRLPQLMVHLLFTREEGKARRLDRARLQRFTHQSSKTGAVFICGPPPMMKRVVRDCVSLGFSRKKIFYEHFSF